MIDAKVSVSIVLPGSILLTQEEAETLEKEQSGAGFTNHSQMVEDQKNKKDREVIHFSTRKCRTANQSLNLTKEAYDYMISLANPEWKTFNDWKKMSRKERLEAHLQRLTEGLGGLSYSYKVFDD